jgi:D-3-phosphoglycerate dehydrogenase
MTTLVVVEMPEDAGCDRDVETSVLGPDVDIVRHSYDGDDRGLISACRDADVIVTAYAPLTRPVIAELHRCRLISVAATGYDCVDLAAAADAGISVCANDEYCTDEGAGHTILLMLTLCRRLLEYHYQVKTENRWQFDSMPGIRRMRGMTLGIVGFGKIGQAVARRAASFGMTVIACDPYVDIGAASDNGVRLCDLPELLAKSEIISLHCSLSAENERLLDKSAFQFMSKKPMLINCARGGLIDEEALLVALDTGQISGAGLDVLTDESPGLNASRLTGRSNVIITLHVAYYSDASILENRRLPAGNIRNFLAGEHAKVRKYVHHAEG